VGKDEMSNRDSRYCGDCQAVLEKEYEIKNTPRNYWKENVFFTGGYGWGIAKNGDTVSLGKERDLLKSIKEGRGLAPV
tara:strand:+ start:8394 stop:8627 length:234 start_codon:yes stop_codon:yes gene_type:complete